MEARSETPILISLKKLKKEFEKVQNRAARFVTRNYDYETGSTVRLPVPGLVQFRVT